MSKSIDQSKSRLERIASHGVEPKSKVRDSLDKIKALAQGSKNAGCEKLPEGAMRNNCEKKQGGGKKASFNLGKMRDGQRITIEAGGVYAHVWFDENVARDDFGNRAKASGEWQIIITNSPDPLNLKPRGRELARKEFRYVEAKSRQFVLSDAEKFVRHHLARHRQASLDETGHLARFEEGKSVDVPKYLREHGNPEAAEAWEEMNEKHRDNFKNAGYADYFKTACGCGCAACGEGEENSEEMFARFEEGVPADPTENMSEEDAEKWEEMNDKYEDQFKNAARLNGYVAFYKGRRIEVHARSSFEAQQIAAEKFRARKPQDVTVMLAEKGGKQVTHMPLFAGKKPSPAEKTEAEKLFKKWYREADSPADTHDLAELKQMFMDGTVSLKDLKENGKDASVKVAASPSGLYGYTRRVQADCESSIRKLQRKASAIAKQAYRKDERVAEFLNTHAKRGKSLSAKLLCSALKDMGPKFASEQGKEASWESPLETEAKRDLVVQILRRKGAQVKAGVAANAFFVGRDSYTIHGEWIEGPRGDEHIPVRDARRWAQNAVNYILSDNERLASKVAALSYAEQHKMLKSNPPKISEKSGVFAVEVYSPSVKKYIVMAEWATEGQAREDLKEWEKDHKRTLKVLAEGEPEGKTAGSKGATGYSLYGYPTKTVRLGLQCCASLREEAGRIASDLHKRRAEMYDHITGFLSQHSKEARCTYSRMLAASYPEGSMKLAADKTFRPGDSVTWNGKPALIVDTHGYPVKSVDLRWTESGTSGSKDEVSGHKRNVPVSQIKKKASSDWIAWLEE